MLGGIETEKTAFPPPKSEGVRSWWVLYPRQDIDAAFHAEFAIFFQPLYTYCESLNGSAMKISQEVIVKFSSFIYWFSYAFDCLDCINNEFHMFGVGLLSWLCADLPLLTLFSLKIKANRLSGRQIENQTLWIVVCRHFLFSNQVWDRKTAAHE